MLICFTTFGLYRLPLSSKSQALSPPFPYYNPINKHLKNKKDYFLPGWGKGLLGDFWKDTTKLITRLADVCPSFQACQKLLSFVCFHLCQINPTKWFDSQIQIQKWACFIACKLKLFPGFSYVSCCKHAWR